MVESIFSQKLYQDFNLNLIDKSWTDFFKTQVEKEYLPSLLNQINKEYQEKQCCPAKKDIFRLFQKISLDQIKVVILGQDPYHQPEVADGIAFSTKKPNYLPPTLSNIFLELSNDLGCPLPNSSNLLPLVKEGVFLLNTALTVKAGEPLSHLELWQEFTYSLIKYLKNYNDKLVWVFWGQKAQLIKNECEISSENSIISSHPSPYSVKYGFSGSKPFSKINNLLIKKGQKPINWLVMMVNE